MAKKERQKRSARKARAAERAEREAVIAREAEAKGIDPEVAIAASKEKKPAKPKDEKPGFFGRIRNWFRDVLTEMRRVVWPTPRELRNYSFAVIGLLIVFGALVWAVDTGVVAGLGAFAGIRPVG
jgi:preprotein translocase subunit SecE